MSEEVVRGKEVTIRFDARKCIHSRHCVLGRPDVFVPNVAGEWIHPDRASSEQLLELAHNCPSGAIRCEAADGTSLEHAPLVNTMRVRENGPLAIHAPLVVDGQPQGLRATLCRCGHSQNKPWCDGSHSAAGFTATGEPAVVESKLLAQRGGTVAVTASKDGPLHLVGNVEVVSGTGKTIKRVTDAWLCRCGHSQNKPWCDGSHKAAGFRSSPEQAES